MTNVQDNVGRTPLHWACYFDHGDIVKTLMIAGADETITDLNWLTPVQLAKTKGHIKLLNMLDEMQIIKRHNTEVSKNWGKFKVAAKFGQLENVIELSTKFIYDVMLLSETLIESCYEGYLKVVK